MSANLTTSLWIPSMSPETWWSAPPWWVLTVLDWWTNIINVSVMLQFMITATFWLLPSLLWKKSHLLGLPIPGSQPSERLELDVVELSQGAEAEERLSGVFTALVDSGLGDIYNRVLCPTCILQIVIINTMVVSEVQRNILKYLTSQFIL